MGRGLVPGLVLGVLLATAGCGSDDSEKKADEPSKAALDCREEWQDLEADVDGEESKTNPSALAPRWNSIGAAVEHYVTSAKADDCGKTIDDEKKAMAALAAFVTKLKPYDMELRLETVKEDAEEYAAGPRPPAPKPSPAKKGKKAKKEPRPPKPADVKAALATLTKQAPLATDQQAPAWQQARAVDLDGRGCGEEGGQGPGLHLQREQGLSLSHCGAGGDPSSPGGQRGLTRGVPVRRR